MVKLFELFSGIGAPRMALEKLGVEYQSLGYSEINKHAINAYCELFNDTPDNNWGDITKIEQLPKDIDILFHGSPCQDFSIAGLKKGGDLGSGTRSSLMHETLRLVKNALPKVVIWENVAAVKFKKNKHNYNAYLEKMNEYGYQNYTNDLNAIDFGTPQNRPRTFCVSILKNANIDFEWLPITKKPIYLTDYVDFNIDNKKAVAPTYCKLVEEFENANGKEMENVILTCQSSKRRKGKVKFSTTKVNTICARKDDYIKYSKGNYAYLTGEEKLKLQNFPDIECISENKKHFVAGNSINVNVLEYIFSCFGDNFLKIPEQNRYKTSYQQTKLFKE